MDLCLYGTIDLWLYGTIYPKLNVYLTYKALTYNHIPIDVWLNTTIRLWWDHRRSGTIDLKLYGNMDLWLYGTMDISLY